MRLSPWCRSYFGVNWEDGGSGWVPGHQAYVLPAARKDDPDFNDSNLLFRRSPFWKGFIQVRQSLDVEDRANHRKKEMVKENGFIKGQRLQK